MKRLQKYTSTMDTLAQYFKIAKRKVKIKIGRFCKRKQNRNRNISEGEVTKKLSFPFENMEMKTEQFSFPQFLLNNIRYSILIAIISIIIILILIGIE